MGRGKRGKRARQAATPCGVVLIDKPKGVTSREALQVAARRLGLRSVGHCGTLDPLATGLIVACSGFGTRVQDLLMGHPKTYLASARLGIRSVSGDAEGPLEPHSESYGPFSEKALREATAEFIGRIRQRPPAHSAIRVDGERLYRKARRGEEVEVPEREVEVTAFDLLQSGGDDLDFQVNCGPGTYIRSLVRDYGESLGCGAYLVDLRRTQSGAHSVEDARPPEELEPEDLIPLERALAGIPRIDLVDQTALATLLAGRALLGPNDEPVTEDTLAFYEGKVVARLRGLDGARYRMKRLIVAPGDDPEI